MKKLLITGDAKPIILWAAGSFLTMAAWFLNPSWDTFSSTPSYHIMKIIASEEVWGLWLLIMGLLGMLSLLYYQHRNFRLIILFSLILTWFLLAASLAYGNIMAFGVGLLLAQSAAMSWAFIHSYMDK